mgnify:CR=1 FL=1
MNLNIFDVDVIAGTGQELRGDLCFPDDGDEVTEDSIIVIPNGSEKYHVPGMRCKAIITEIGNRMCHLAIVTREQGKPMVKLNNAVEALKDVKRVWMHCGRKVVAEIDEDE